MFTLASLRSDWWSTCPELVDDFIGIRNPTEWITTKEAAELTRYISNYFRKQ
jgi:hypothetical protein